MSIVIDFHVHAVMYEQRASMAPGRLPDDADVYECWRQYDSPSAVDDLLAENGVDYAVALPESSPVTSGSVSSERVAQFCHGSERLIPFASVNPFLTTYPAKYVEYCVRELGCKGLKLYPPYQYFYPNDPLVYPVYARAEELGIPVMFHTGSSVFRGSRLKYADPLLLDDVAVDFPDLTIIMAHSGRPLWYDQAFFLARLHQNVFMEISGLPPQNLLSYFPEFERNADKIIFGSDWPGYRNIKRNMDVIRALPIGDEAKEKMLGGNAARILERVNAIPPRR